MRKLKKKIIISIYDDLKNPYYGGGGAVAVHEVAKRLSHYYEVTVLTGAYRGCRNEVIDEVIYRRIGFSFLGPKSGQALFQMMLPYYVLTSSYDLWMESFTPPFSTACLQLFTKKPVIALTHMLSGEDMLRKYKLPFFLIEKLGLKTYKHFIVLTKQLRDKIMSENSTARITIIPNGVTKQKRIVNYHKKHILYLGRLEIDQKGLDLLLASYAQIKTHQLPELIIAGSAAASEKKRLESMIDELGLTKKVRCIGRVNDKQKAQLFANAYFTVIPSRFESFGIVALESFCYGAPVITFDITSLRWIPDSCSLKVQPFSVHALRNAITRLITQPYLRAEMGEKAKRYAASYSWASIAKQYKSYVSSLLSSPESKKNTSAVRGILPSGKSALT